MLNIWRRSTVLSITVWRGGGSAQPHDLAEGADAQQELSWSEDSMGSSAIVGGDAFNAEGLDEAQWRLVLEGPDEAQEQLSPNDCIGRSAREALTADGCVGR